MQALFDFRQDFLYNSIETIRNGGESLKKGHNPNRLQKVILDKNGYNWDEWVVIKVFPNTVIFKKKDSDETIELENEKNIRRY